MQIKVRGLALAWVFFLAFTVPSSADVAQQLTVHLSMFCPPTFVVCQVTPYQEVPGTPAAGHVNFGVIDQPWSFNFETGDPLDWKCDWHCEDYNANFGVGGTFMMDGPDGLTFLGEITSGTAWQNLDIASGALLSFSGKWSNGLSAYGNLLDSYTEQNGPYASLDVYTAPEPASLALMGGGVLAVWGLRRRHS